MSTIHLDVLRAGLRSRRPVYVYDLERLRRRCHLLRCLDVPRTRVFFATMANDHPQILSCVRDCGLGAFVNSRHHLGLVRSLGFEPSRVIYAATNMTPAAMRACLQAGVNLVLDSVGQLLALTTLAEPGCEVAVRLNLGGPDGRGGTAPDPSYRFGLLPEQLPLAVSLAARSHIRIVGAHSYLGTNLMRVETLVQGLDRLGEVAAALPDLRFIDAAGGFGVPDSLDDPEFNLQAYGRQAARVMRQLELKLGRELELYLEPGRYLVADSGYFFVKVVDCKLRPDRAFVGTNGSVALFPRPLLYPGSSHHPCEIVGKRGDNRVHPHPVYVCGDSTYSQDFLARGIALPLPQPGDTLVFHHAGAYGRSMFTHFLGKRRPDEVFTDSGIFAEAVS
jgi:diaminopimelate decarboxylase